MFSRIGILFFLMLLPLTTQAGKGQFELSVGEKIHIFSPTCIKSLHYTKPDEADLEYLSFQLTNACGERMAKITHENMAKQLTMSCEGNVLFSAMIIQRLSSSFRFTTEKTSRMVLMQIIKDYDVSAE